MKTVFQRVKVTFSLKKKTCIQCAWYYDFIAWHTIKKQIMLAFFFPSAGGVWNTFKSPSLPPTQKTPNKQKTTARRPLCRQTHQTLKSQSAIMSTRCTSDVRLLHHLRWLFSAQWSKYEDSGSAKRKKKVGYNGKILEQKTLKWKIVKEIITENEI